MNHKNLDAWNAATELALQVYQVTNGFPKEEIYSLTSQVRRAAVSVPSNIAEGAARSSDKEFVQFLYIALGSLAELETQIIIAEKLAYIREVTALQSRISSLKQMILGLIKYLKNKQLKQKVSS
jgi:four helix bundle protein